MSRKYRIAFFSANYPPQLDAESLVSGKLASWLRGAGHDVQIYSARSHPERSDRFRLGLRNAGALFRHSFRMISRQTFYPTRMWELNDFVHAALRDCAREHRAKPFDVAISRYMPIESAVAAYWASRELKLPWVACFNDPYPFPVPADENALYRFLRWIDAAEISLWHRRFMEAPRWHVYPCKELQDWMSIRARESGIPADSLPLRSSVLPHMGEDPTSYPLPQAPEGGEGRLVLRYIGTLTEVRDISSLLAALETWDKSDRPPVLMEFVGSTYPGQKRRLLEFGQKMKGRVKIGLRDPVSPDKAFRLMLTSSALVLTDWWMETSGQRSVFLPSKFCDYATARRPILAITAQQSATRTYLENLGGGLAVSHGDAQGIFEALGQLLDTSYSAGQALAAQFSPDRVGGQWENLLAHLVDS